MAAAGHHIGLQPNEIVPRPSRFRERVQKSAMFSHLTNLLRVRVQESGSHVDAPNRARCF
jgi:hypothetical protein